MNKIIDYSNEIYNDDIKQKIINTIELLKKNM